LDCLDIQHSGRFTQEIFFCRCPACGQRNIVKDGWFACGVCGRTWQRRGSLTCWRKGIETDCLAGSHDTPPICYEACLGYAQEVGASVHMPRIGCGLAGGKWEQIEPLIGKTLCEKDVAVTIYDF
jgi:hypothetical protein